MGSAAAYLPADTAKELFGRQTPQKVWPVIAGQGAANGQGVVEDKGFRLSGKWSYASGLLHSTWIHTGATVIENRAPRMLPGGKLPEVRIFILPATDAKLRGNWDVMGLRATGRSTTPSTMCMCHSNIRICRVRIRRCMGERCSISPSLVSARSVIPALRSVLDGACLMSCTRLRWRRAGGRKTLPVRGGGESFLEQYGVAEAKYRAVRALAYDCWGDIERTLDRGDRPTTRQLTLARLALNYATTAVVEICAFAYRFGGGIALRQARCSVASAI